MRVFRARAAHSNLSKAISTNPLDLEPVQPEVRLLTMRQQAMIRNGQEVTWDGLWDTGARITVIPKTFVLEMRIAYAGWTDPIEGFDSEARSYKFYNVLIGVPDMPLLRVRAIAPDDRLPQNPRRYITLGRDVLMRLSISCVSNVPWDNLREPSSRSVWKWHYRKATQDDLRWLSR